mgnify:CR=1 FL=1
MAFYNKMRKDAVRDLENSVERYNGENSRVTSLAEDLFTIRSNDCQRILTLVERFINSFNLIKIITADCWSIIYK